MSDPDRAGTDQVEPHHSALRGLAAGLETLAASFPEPVYLIDTEGTIIAVNDAMCSRSRFPRDAFVGSRFDLWVEPAARSRIRSEFSAALAGETRRYRADGRSADGSASRAEVTNIPVRLDGEVIAVAGIAIDITGVERRERAREKADDLLRIAGELASFGAWELDVATGQLTMTPQSQSILGYVGLDTIGLADAIDLFSSENAAKIRHAVTMCLEHGESVDFTLDVVIPDGSRRVVRAVGEPIAAAPDKPVTAAHGALWDITAAVEAREREEVLQQRLDLALDSLGDGMVFLDESWRIVYANARSVELMARPFTEVVGRSVWECFPELADTDLEVAYQRAARDQVRTTVRTFDVHSDSWLDVTAYPTRGGLALYVRDVTDDEQARRQIEDAHRRIEDQAALIDAARDAIIVRSLDHTIRYWNRSAAELYGWAAGDAIGTSIRTLLFSDPKDFDAAVAAVLREGYWSGELEHRTRDGRAVIIDCRWQLLRDADGRPDRVLSVDTDVTTWRREENQRARAQRMESLGTLAGGIAHDLNNVLTPILMSVQLLAGSETDPRRLELLATTETAVKRGADMIKQVLSFARGVEGRRERVDIADLLDELRRFAVDTLPGSIRFEVVVDDDVTGTTGDVTQLMQVLTNLVTNARDAMPSGGELRVTASTILLEDALSSLSHQAMPGRYNLIEVTDTGHGMPPEIVEKIFEPFYTTKSLGKGTGLGLASSLAIVRSHGGSIRVYSEPERGTRFSVILPVAEGDPEQNGHRPIPARQLPRGRGELVLIVDDEPTIRLITAQALESHGYRTLTAENGRVAIELVDAAENDIDLVLTDMMMPITDGAATTAYLEEHHPGIAVVAASGLSLRNGAVRPIGMGVSAFLPKPYTTSMLLTTIRDAIDGHPQDDENGAES